MEEKDYIYIYDSKGKKIKMELILVMNSKEKRCQYIAYKEVDKLVPLYMGKLHFQEGISELDTNLTDEEQTMLIKAIKQKIMEGSKND